MQVIIPMTGYGSRFKAAGYDDLKPFIKVCGKTMVEWVSSMYSNDTPLFFIIRESTLKEKKYEDVMTKITNSRDNGKTNIIKVKDEDWKKEGPAVDTLYAKDLINPNDSIVINYCDFFCLWNSKEFDSEASSLKVDGAIPCYTGFHPHIIPFKNVYACCFINENNKLIKIIEKYDAPFFNDRETLHQSPGIYWYKDFNTFETALNKALDAKDNIKGEYYASIIYNYMDNVWVTDNVSHMCQWGTPEDLKEFELWMKELGGIK